jgi:hypothetical protein
MSNDADLVGIQRQPESLSTRLSRTSSAATQGSALPLPQQWDANLRLSSASQLLRRLSVLGVGLALGAVFSLWVTGPMISSGWRIADRAELWAVVMGGPIVGTAWGMGEYHPIILESVPEVSPLPGTPGRGVGGEGFCS